MHFTGIFHEELQIPAEIRVTLHNADVRIIHKPWCQEDFNKKLTRNMSMLKEHMEKYPDSIYQLIDLIRLYLETGQLSEAEELLQKANALILRRNYDERRYQLYATQYYQNHLRFLARINAAADMILSLCKQALVIVPACPLFLFESAQQCYKLCEYDASINYFQQCLAFGRDNNFDRSVIFPRYMMSYGSLSGLGYCFFRKKRYLEAMRYFEESHAFKHDKNIKAMLLASDLLAKQTQPVRGSGITV